MFSGSALFSTPSEVAAMRSYLNQLKTCCYLQQKALKACKKEMKFLSNLIDASTSSAQASIIQMISAFFRSNYEYVVGAMHFINATSAVDFLNFLGAIKGES